MPALQFRLVESLPPPLNDGWVIGTLAVAIVVLALVFRRHRIRFVRRTPSGNELTFQIDPPVKEYKPLPDLEVHLQPKLKLEGTTEEMQDE